MSNSNNGTRGHNRIGPIVLACDDRYVMPLTVTLRSIVESNQPDWPIAFYVLASNVSALSRQRAEASLPTGAATIHWIAVELESFEGFSKASHLSSVTFARLLISSLMPEVTGRILYLDSDILVIQSLRPLWEIDMKGALLGAVGDGGIKAMIERKDPRHAALPRVKNYFNSGVMVLDLDLYRTGKLAEHSMEFMRLHPNTPYSDQDALNASCADRWHPLDTRWNYQTYRHLPHILQLAPESRPAILHFVMSVKPWQYKELHSYTGFYDAFRARTTFARTPREKTLNGLKTAWMHCMRTIRSALPFLPRRNG